MAIVTTKVRDSVNRFIDSNLNGVNDVAVKVRVHTAKPGTEAAPNAATGIPTGGGDNYTLGVDVTGTAWTRATTTSPIEIKNAGAIDFGPASGNVGTLRFWSAAVGTDIFAMGALASTPTVNNNDSFQINANTLKITATTTDAT